MKLSYLLTAAAVTFRNGHDGEVYFYFIFIFGGATSPGQSILSGTHIVMHEIQFAAEWKVIRGVFCVCLQPVGYMY